MNTTTQIQSSFPEPNNQLAYHLARLVTGDAVAKGLALEAISIIVSESNLPKDKLENLLNKVCLVVKDLTLPEELRGEGAKFIARNGSDIEQYKNMVLKILNGNSDSLPIACIVGVLNGIAGKIEFFDSIIALAQISEGVVFYQCLHSIFGFLDNKELLSKFMANKNLLNRIKGLNGSVPREFFPAYWAIRQIIDDQEEGVIETNRHEKIAIAMTCMRISGSDPSRFQLAESELSLFVEAIRNAEQPSEYLINRLKGANLLACGITYAEREFSYYAKIARDIDMLTEAGLTHLALPFDRTKYKEFLAWISDSYDPNKFHYYEPGEECDSSDEIGTLHRVMHRSLSKIIDKVNIILFGLPVYDDLLSMKSGELGLDNIVKPILDVFNQNPQAKVLMIDGLASATKINTVNLTSLPSYIVCQNSEIVPVSILCLNINDQANLQGGLYNIEEARIRSARITDFALPTESLSIAEMPWSAEFIDRNQSSLVSCWDGVICYNEKDDGRDRTRKKVPKNSDGILPRVPVGVV